MSSFVPCQDEGSVVPAPTGAFSGQTLEKQPVPWPAVLAMFKTSSDPSPGSSPLIAQNTTFEQDKATMLELYLAMGGKEDVLRKKY